MPSLATPLSAPDVGLTSQWRQRAVCTLAVLTGLLPCGASAQSIYRSEAASGHVTFSDTPPPSATKLQSLEVGTQTSESNGPALPFALRQVVDKYPVTFYAAKDCEPCNTGRNLLLHRGVPFAEKSINTNEDMDALQRLSGSISMPFLTIGSQHIKGYSNIDWAQYLSAAGYPEQSQLPKGFRNPAATPLVLVEKPAPPGKAASAPGEKPAPGSAPLNRVNPANPAGIQF